MSRCCKSASGGQQVHGVILRRDQRPLLGRIRFSRYWWSKPSSHQHFGQEFYQEKDGDILTTINIKAILHRVSFHRISIIKQNHSNAACKMISARATASSHTAVHLLFSSRISHPIGVAFVVRTVNERWAGDIDALNELVAPAAGAAETFGRVKPSLTIFPSTSESARMLQHFVALDSRAQSLDD